MSFSVGYQSVGEGSIRSQQHLSSNDGTTNSVMSMDEAYRRLGHKLSQRVTSGQDYRAHVAFNLGSHPCSAFASSSGGSLALHQQIQQQDPHQQQQHQQSSNNPASTNEVSFFNQHNTLTASCFLDLLLPVFIIPCFF